ncbi:trypsin-like peptidase domain-containing protein [Vibrio sp. D431a]|uniref:trypsin-like peptidase domain-containing protein n=1 Tax=Vibrio sp. D431a TaxID=2837388 RepID=UPI0025566996|nr:trypsin-like peptidase domain-containing protein [Vibrio sp. D431a]MDK9790014.1 serine protease [Vibrio sp. D431a]
MRKLALILPALLLQGCAYVQNGTFDYAENSPDLNYLPIGIPYLAGGHGTGVPITDNVSITAAHLATYDYSKVIAYHPDCDIALIAADNTDKEKLKIGTVFENQKVSSYGFGLSSTEIVSHGQFIMNVTLDGYPKCVYSLSTSAQKSGMSGGAVVNDKNELVGVIHGVGFNPPIDNITGKPIKLPRYSYFVSMNFIRGWLEQNVPELAK